MTDEAFQMQQIDAALVERPAHTQSSYMGWVLRKAWSCITLASPRSHLDRRPDGMEAFDMLGGWNGSDAGPRDL
ncbi:hypothetical protein ACHMW7_06950 [Aminobacter sp. UC22_36]|uniref:hypothetical protein n=1 Tax=Aminobacter sp. UC22_36 TaxID=3374549 RepID=UPI0037564EE6